MVKMAHVLGVNVSGAYVKFPILSKSSIILIGKNNNENKDITTIQNNCFVEMNIEISEMK